jgi:uncharacterized CHY-type Zn-finger protein
MQFRFLKKEHPRLCHKTMIHWFIHSWCISLSYNDLSFKILSQCYWLIHSCMTSLKKHRKVDTNESPSICGDCQDGLPVTSTVSTDSCAGIVWSTLSHSQTQFLSHNMQ